MIKTIHLLFILFVSLTLRSQSDTEYLLEYDSPQQQQWVEQTYAEMTVQEKIGQLFTIAGYANKNQEHIDNVIGLIKNYHVGGITFFKGTPTAQAILTNRYQSLSKVPLLVSMDAEWDLGMRLDSTYRYPWNMTLGAIKDNSIMERIGAQVGKHCKRIGVHMNFAPVVDINTNPKNPIIGNRSFGEDKENVAEKSAAFVRGMQGAGVLGCAKHFPGHGDTATDSHKTLPTIHFDAARIDSIELHPYRRIFKEGVASVMVAHLNVPSMETKDGLPSSLSYDIVTRKLKEDLGYKGIVYTDALNMRGVADFDEAGTIDLVAFMAGSDNLLMSEDVPKAALKLRQAYADGLITEARLAFSVKKNLKAKHTVNLHKYQPIALEGLVSDLGGIEDDLLYREAMQKAITIVHNDAGLVPIHQLQDRSIGYLALGDDSGKPFYKMLRNYADVSKIEKTTLEEITTKASSYDAVIIGFHKSNANPWKSYKFSTEELAIIEALSTKTNVILDVFASPYSLLQIKNLDKITTTIVSYQNHPLAQEISAQIIFGAIGAQGVLPVSIDSFTKVDCGSNTYDLGRLGYTIPEAVGMSSHKLKEVDSLAQTVVDQQMAPGLQLLIARKGKVIYNKAYGYHTYDKQLPVQQSDLYDLASLTKILATVPSLMQLHEQGQLTLDSQFQELMPQLSASNKAEITLKEALSHYARFKPWIPYYIETLDSLTGQPLPEFYSKQQTSTYATQVAAHMYLNKQYTNDSIVKKVVDSDLLERLRYRYSDLPYYLLKEYIETQQGTSMAASTQENFYESLGAYTMTYNPLDKFWKNNITPSEKDTYFRHQVVQGYVHDMGAAMQGGVGGHAGLFSNANDVAKMMQLYLQKGYYGGQRYFEDTTFDQFNTCHYCDKKVRRGVGFDKPQLGDQGPTCGCVSMESFGHSGFTGTYTWADPEQELIYVFLSNRTYPTMENKELIKTNIRTIIQQAIYEAIEDRNEPLAIKY